MSYVPSLEPKNILPFQAITIYELENVAIFTLYRFYQYWQAGERFAA